MKKLLIVGLVLAALAVVAVVKRHRIIAHSLGLFGMPELSEPADEGPNVRWHDDYFTVQALDDRTFAIGEPRYYQQNYSYLIEGTERAVLFDAGPGHRDIRPVAQSLTDRPITFIPSHFHFDHVGNEVTFDRVAVVDLPHLRERAPDGQLQLTFEEHLGAAEGIDEPTLVVDEWIAHRSRIALGDRTLLVLYTPGHTEDSISLLDLESGYLFTGDFIYPGPLVAFLPNSAMGDYLQATQTVLGAAPTSARVFGAHRDAPPGAPELGVEDVRDLRATLRAIRAGDLVGAGLYPVIYPINARLELYADPSWLQSWEPRNPELR
jgi:glyoxylase-like metal-dependent hydrolase (beta-lactamase superfamily II)